MSDPTGTSDDPAPDDLGDPIEELALLDDEPAPGFLGRLLGRLRRRELGAQLTAFGWSGLAEVVIEFIRMVASLFETRPRDQGGSD